MIRWKRVIVARTGVILIRFPENASSVTISFNADTKTSVKLIASSRMKHEKGASLFIFPLFFFNTVISTSEI